MALKQQAKTSSKNVKNNNTRIKSNLRKCNTNEIDTTGKRFIFQVRGASYPPIRGGRTLSRQKNSKNCKFCNQNHQYIDSLEASLRNLELIADKMSRVKVTTNSLEKAKFDFSDMDIEELLNISQNIRLEI
ncbi:4892_t:CDS:2 [Ambispora gerdemannii]|uniref:4892_t:CDS:1 n=1 Tax=Ambispora gerdemannii TaxID=144530 RepID=A0A9N9B289_9GLOM|nr:4892_t:CDS:2 [Ambispora gerdemannii]